MDGVGQPLIPLSGSRKKQPKVNIIVNVYLASLPGPPGFLHLPWVQVLGGCVTDAWPCIVSLLCKISALLGHCIGLRMLGIWVTLAIPPCLR